MSFTNAFKAIRNKFTSAKVSQDLPALTLPQIKADPQLMQMLADVLIAEGMKPAPEGTSLLLPGGLILTAERLENITLAEDKIRTCTRIYLNHASYFPLGLNEYQHAMGAIEEAAITEGFRTWARMDLLTLLDAIDDTPKACTVIEMNVTPESETAEGKSPFRQVILGPVAHLATLAAPKQKEEHPFCPCCLFTESMDAFHDLLQTDQFLGVRLFASRDNDGNLAADCRVNGEDFLPALDYLKSYAKKWPQRGLEFRKQYVVIRSSDRSVNPAPAGTTNNHAIDPAGN
ncbi:DUF6348 family protein [Undibacterium sp. TJN19]|uniref:DUF6348 family protein n=1 Tax=Undibacterium sp. TJN19 TaxID=3413055 RepID=UPI003BF25A2B